MTTQKWFGAVAMLCGSVLQAQGAAKLPPIHPLGPTAHRSAELLGAVSAARALPGGKVLVNDINGRKVVLYDSALVSAMVVADTSSATANAYSSRAAGLIAYKGDSTLFVDPQSLSMLLIDPKGEVIRVMSIPLPNAAGALIGGPNGTPGFDARGRLVFRSPPNFRFGGGRPGGPGSPGGQRDGERRDGAGRPGEQRDGRPGERDGGPRNFFPEMPDSQVIVAIELATRKIDTIAFVKVAKQNISVTQRENGGMSISTKINPLQVVDDWAVMSDGSVAIVRGIDYHVDWIRPDGSKSSSAKVPFDWRKMSDSDKVAFIDSTRAAMEKLRERFQEAMKSGNPAQMGQIMQGADVSGMAGAMMGGMGGGREVFVMRGGPEGGRGGENPRPRNETPAAAMANFQLPPLEFVDPLTLPDYAPPFAAGSARGDADGNLWVRTSNVVSGGSVYDVIDNGGNLIDRVLLPAGRVIAGFGRGGVVYMGVRDGAGVRLEQARRQPVM